MSEEEKNVLIIILIIGLFLLYKSDNQSYSNLLNDYRYYQESIREEMKDCPECLKRLDSVEKRLKEEWKENFWDKMRNS